MLARPLFSHARGFMHKNLRRACLIRVQHSSRTIMQSMQCEWYIVHRPPKYSICNTTKYHATIITLQIATLSRVHEVHHAGRFSFPSSSITRAGLSTCLPVCGKRFGLLLPSARSASKLSSSKDKPPTPSHLSSSRLGSARRPPRSMRRGDSAMDGRRARVNFPVRGGVLLVSESNLVTNDASARRSSSSCCRAYTSASKKNKYSSAPSQICMGLVVWSG